MVLVAFMAISVIGQIVWITAVRIVGEIDMWWCSIGFAFGIVLGYIHGKWIARMWDRDYLRVLKARDYILASERGKGHYYTYGACARHSNFLRRICETFCRQLGRVAIIYFRFYLRD